MGKEEEKIQVAIFDGSPTVMNDLVGEAYGVDWEYRGDDAIVFSSGDLVSEGDAIVRWPDGVVGVARRQTP